MERVGMVYLTFRLAPIRYLSDWLTLERFPSTVDIETHNQSPDSLGSDYMSADVVVAISICQPGEQRISS